MSLKEILKTNNASTYIKNTSYINNEPILEPYNNLQCKQNNNIIINFDLCPSIENDQDSQELIDFNTANNNRLIAPTKASTKLDKSFTNKLCDL